MQDYLAPFPPLLRGEGGKGRENSPVYRKMGGERMGEGGGEKKKTRFPHPIGWRRERAFKICCIVVLLCSALLLNNIRGLPLHALVLSQAIVLLVSSTACAIRVLHGYSKLPLLSSTHELTL